MTIRDSELKLPSKQGATPVSVALDTFDFDLLMAGIHESMVPPEAITPEVKDVILKLAFLYEIDPIQMKNILYRSVNENNEIDLEVLRKNARDWYTIEHYGSLPKLVDRVQSPLYQSEITVPKTQEERLIRYLETVSPRQVLADLSDGSEPVESDLKLIEDIMIRLKLTPGVVNVLIQYCMLQTDMKLSRSYVEKLPLIGREKVKLCQKRWNWRKANIENMLNGKNKQEKKPVKRRVTRSEPVPDWLENPQQAKSQNHKRVTLKSERKIRRTLKKYKNRR